MNENMVLLFVVLAIVLTQCETKSGKTVLDLIVDGRPSEARP